MTKEWTAAAVAAFLLAGCGASKETSQPMERKSFADEIRKYEESFHPSDYDLEPGSRSAKGSAQSAADSARQLAALTPATPEMVQGFRVQLYSTTSIDDAEARKRDAEEIFPTEWFYLEYDPPTYKVRAGNFVNRFEADRFAKLLSDKGFSNAWTVPERVYKQPPPPVHDEKPPDQ